MSFRLLVLVLGLAPVAGCQLEPDASCDDTRIAWGFDEHELSSADDVSAEPGLQIDLLLLSALPEGKPAVLSVTGPDDVEVVHPQVARVDADGHIFFESVEVPTGSVRFTLRSENDCREVESSQRRFVLDEGGPAVCEIEFIPPTHPIAGQTKRAYNAGDDQDALLPQLQAEIRAFTQRAQVTVRLLTLDRSTGTTTAVERTTGASGETFFAVSLGQGDIAVRALCTGGPNETPQSTATFDVLVDTTPPDCELIEPSSRVTPADDIDGNAANGVQVVAIAQTSDESGAGLGVDFSINGEITPGVIGPAGQSTAILTVPTTGPQAFEVTLPDLAGNLCTASASL